MNFLLGVGAQKAGTTWLSNYLKGHYECNMGFTKEYEVFTYIDIADTGHFSIQRKQIAGILNRQLKLNKADLAHFKLMTFYCDEDEYFKYFSDILKEDVLLTGDITPSYAALTSKSYKKIKDKFSRLGIRTKVIFMMRDPVDRNVSATKLYLGNRSEKLIDPLTDDDFNKMTLVNYQNVMNIGATRYDLTIQNIEAIFDPEDVLYVFYEDLFDLDKMAGETKRICDFLGISYIQPNPEKVNESKYKFEVYPETKKFIYDYYKPVYDFVENKFGRLPWIRY